MSYPVITAIYNMIYRHYIRPETDLFISAVVATTNEYEECFSEAATLVHQKTRPARARFVSSLILEGRSRFGFLKRSEPNRMMLRKYLYGVCLDHQVRPTHIALLLDLAVEAYFIPTDVDVAIAEVRYARAAKQQNKALADVEGSTIRGAFSGVFGRG
jgi:hypothetical protein